MGMSGSLQGLWSSWVPDSSPGGCQQKVQVPPDAGRCPDLEYGPRAPLRDSPQHDLGAASILVDLMVKTVSCVYNLNVLK